VQLTRAASRGPHLVLHENAGAWSYCVPGKETCDAGVELRDALHNRAVAMHERRQIEASYSQLPTA